MRGHLLCWLSSYLLLTGALRHSAHFKLEVRILDILKALNDEVARIAQFFCCLDIDRAVHDGFVYYSLQKTAIRG